MLNDKIEVVRKVDYKGCPIYIRKIGHLFEYIVVYKKQIYSHYYDIKPERFKKDYTSEQLENIMKLVYHGAYTTIDSLKSK